MLRMRVKLLTSCPDLEEILNRHFGNFTPFQRFQKASTVAIKCVKLLHARKDFEHDGFRVCHAASPKYHMLSVMIQKFLPLSWTFKAKWKQKGVLSFI